MYFTDSPFSAVADPSTARCWSGRPQALNAVQRVHQSLLRRSDQSFDLLWANLGAGKTHTLNHLAYLFNSSEKDGNRTICCFVEMPEQVKGFLDLYREVIRGLPLERVCAAVLAAPKAKGTEVFKAANVLLNGGTREQDVVLDWIQAGRPRLTDLRACSGIGHRIEDDIAATEVLSTIVNSLAFSSTRLLLLIDEFQRVGVLGQSARNRSLSSLRTLFSRSPKYLSAVLAVQSVVAESAFKLVPPELQTLIGGKPTISLPEMDIDEAEEFVLGRFDFFRPSGFKGERSAPFQGEAIRELLLFLRDQKKAKLIPREILQALAFVFDSVGETNGQISGATAVSCLREFGDQGGHA